MNDIQWRLPGDESERLLRENPNSKVLVETDITHRVDYAQYIRTNGWPWYLNTSNEFVIRFAFIGTLFK